MSEVKTGYFVVNGDELYRRLHCATDSDDYIEVGPSTDHKLKYLFNIEMKYTPSDESGESSSVNLDVESAKLLIKDLQKFIADSEGTE
ncbi:hypothetical protein BCPG3_148 [Bacillus phage BCPG3]|uniref:Uncharacterized protein n=1 Tax=Bacillus phage BPS10C TaxID=1277886 RepID=W5QUC2_9CAUD|nr:hypothetical protein BPS10C_164 [Bacillus phage BPS10C]AGI12161.1 hypothetical protein BPS10C_164 [Bacillus phage BPS10C]QQO38844.1 hypothetical protein BCPG1_113 [Bacillus phage BCPG1]QSJ04465.1 hypothetical protein BCPG3_148 [Bacillus phage BCPG3]QSJ04674.1 hypothetical protein BCP18_142 [Bacillus phage BCP18]